MSLKRRALDGALRLLTTATRVLGEHTQARVWAHIVERLSPLITVDTPLGPLKFHCPGDVLLFRANTLLTKEPETIEWIDTFDEGDVFWDVGANVGMYSLYAALKPGVRVVAFEPAVVNCCVLNRNIEVNGLDSRVMALCVAFTDVTTLDYLRMESTRAGAASHGFGEAGASGGGQQLVQFKQGAVGLSMDEFVETYRPAFPNHIKVDVDGIEDRILRGATRTIADARVKSVLVEMDIDRTDYCRQVGQMFENVGMRLLHRKRTRAFDVFPQTSGYNHVFVRSQGVL